MNRSSTHLLALGMVAALLLGPQRAAAQGGEAWIPKLAVRVSLQRFQRYWQNPNAAEPKYETYSWRPLLDFNIWGPIAPGAQLEVDWFKPGGAPWVTDQVLTQPLDAEAMASYSIEQNASDENEKRGIVATGECKFVVRLRNALEGTNAVLFTGSYTVRKIPPPPNGKPGETDFFVDHDWALPFAALWGDEEIDELAPALCCGLWFRGPVKSEELSAHLFHEGRPVTDSKTLGGCDLRDSYTTPGMNTGDPIWQRFDFWLNAARLFNKNTVAELDDRVTVLAEQPGTYEIRVLRFGDLARSLSFEIDGEGNIVALAASREQRLSWWTALVPTKILGTHDGAWDAEAWRTAAFYGNPMEGFTP